MTWRKGASVLALAAALLLPACGAGGEDEAAPTPAGPAIDLRVEADAESATLTCDPVGGTHPRAEAACEALAAHPEALAPFPPDAACTQIYGGDETASVTGTFRGEPVDASFSRENGCEISRWDALRPLLRLGD
jgi:hypothetical protein